MQLVLICSIVVALLALASGITFFAGSKKGERTSSFFFLLATTFAAIWVASIGIFLNLPETATEVAPIVAVGIYGAPLFMCAFFLLHVAHNKAMTGFGVFFFFVSVFFLLSFLYDPGLAYTEIILQLNDNTIKLVNGWWYWGYAAAFIVSTILIYVSLYRKLLQSFIKELRYGYITLIIGTALCSFVAILTDLILPITLTYRFIYLGAIFIASPMIAYYISVLRYKIVSFSYYWLNVMSYIIVACTMAIVYMGFFSVTYVVYREVPNSEMLFFLLNFLLITATMLILPMMENMQDYLRRLVQKDSVDLSYIVRKLNKIAGQKVNLPELAAFVAKNMHFSYIGFLVNGKLYSSNERILTKDELYQITLLPSATNNIWQDFTQPVTYICERYKIGAIAELRNSRGEAFGQILIGKPNDNSAIDRKDLVQLEMVINLISLMVESN